MKPRRHEDTEEAGFITEECVLFLVSPCPHGFIDWRPIRLKLFGVKKLSVNAAEMLQAAKAAAREANDESADPRPWLFTRRRE